MRTIPSQDFYALKNQDRKKYQMMLGFGARGQRAEVGLFLSKDKNLNLLLYQRASPSSIEAHFPVQKMKERHRIKFYCTFAGKQTTLNFCQDKTAL